MAGTPRNRGLGRAIGEGPKSDKLWREALMRAIKRRDKDGVPFLDKLAATCIDCALAGDMSAMKEIGDRIDGRPVQQVEGTGAGGAIKIEVVTGVPDRAS